MRSWNVIGCLPVESDDDAVVGTLSCSEVASASLAESDAGVASCLRRMRAVIGSSAVECFCRTHDKGKDKGKDHPSIAGDLGDFGRRVDCRYLYCISSFHTRDAEK